MFGAEGGVDQAHLDDGAFQGATERAGVDADPLSHREGSGDEQDQPGEQVAQRLLGRDAHDHAGQRSADEELLDGDGQQGQRAQEHHEVAEEQAQHPGGGGRGNAGVAGCAGHLVGRAARGDQAKNAKTTAKPMTISLVRNAGA